MQNQINYSVIVSDFNKIDQLVHTGKINAQTGMALKNQVISNAFGSTSSPSLSVDPSQITTTSSTSPSSTHTPNDNILAPNQKLLDSFQEFESKNANFFNSPARSILKNYLIQNFDDLSTQSLQIISNIVRELENSAVNSYKSQLDHSNSINSANEAAKLKLNSNATYSSRADQSIPKVFSRQDIDSMSSEEFLALEPQIMAQLKNEMSKLKK